MVKTTFNVFQVFIHTLIVLRVPTHIRFHHDDSSTFHKLQVSIFDLPILPETSTRLFRGSFFVRPASSTSEVKPSSKGALRHLGKPVVFLEMKRGAYLE